MHKKTSAEETFKRLRQSPFETVLKEFNTHPKPDSNDEMLLKHGWTRDEFSEHYFDYYTNIKRRYE